MKDGLRKVAAIHDLSGVGRCSLGAALPVLSCLQAQVCPIPTAVLSTQTGGYRDYHFVDLTRELPGIFKHLYTIGLEFDAIYSGFLGSPEQIDMVAAFLQKSKKADALVMVDPVMGDGGQLYTIYDQTMIEKMRALVSMADCITPNMTEAAFLLDLTPSAEGLDDPSMRVWAKRLCAMGPKTAVITGIMDAMGNYYVAAYDTKTERFLKIPCAYLPGEYPGTGDLYTSVLTGLLLKGIDLHPALIKAGKFVYHAIEATIAAKTPSSEGVLFETVLHTLFEQSLR